MKKIYDCRYWKNRQGSFAEILVEEATNNTVLVRDHMGLEPLYYYCHKGQFFYESTLPKLIAKLPSRPEFNHEQLVALVTRNQIYSDETIYQNIYRAEPGVITTITSNDDIKKEAFWQLDPEGCDIKLSSDAAYLERFSALMHEAVDFCTQGDQGSLCGKMSGGLDSGSIFITAQHLGVSYPLFMQTALADGHLIDDRETCESLLKRFNFSDITYIDAEQFDPITSFEYCADRFAGPAPYMVYMYMMHVYKMIIASGRSIVLSGAGGDDCVSGHATNSYYFRTIYKQAGWGHLWHEISQLSQLSYMSPKLVKRIAVFIQAAHPGVYRYFKSHFGVDYLVKLFIRSQNRAERKARRSSGNTVRQREWDLLQGPSSHALRMRVEYNAVLGKSMNLGFRYPLLYPKLLEYCLYLPLRQKRRDGFGRFLIRQYLKKMGAPKALYQQQQKQGGIIPGVLDKCYKLLQSGAFASHFANLPYAEYADVSTVQKKLITNTLMYMLKYSCASR